jgi:hypothetical protein
MLRNFTIDQLLSLLAKKNKQATEWVMLKKIVEI